MVKGFWGLEGCGHLVFQALLSYWKLIDPSSQPQGKVGAGTSRSGDGLCNLSGYKLLLPLSRPRMTTPRQVSSTTRISRAPRLCLFPGAKIHPAFPLPRAQKSWGLTLLQPSCPKTWSLSPLPHHLSWTLTFLIFKMGILSFF